MKYTNEINTARFAGKWEILASAEIIPNKTKQNKTKQNKTKQEVDSDVN